MLRKIGFILFCLFPLSAIAQNQIEIEDRFIKKIDKRGKITFQSGKKTQIKGFGKADHAVFFLVRHAEKVPDGTQDPLLTEAGTARANKLAEILNAVSLTNIYTTRYKRNTLTAEPTALQKNIATIVYTPSNQYQTYQAAKEIPKSVYLWVGHSNTIPDLADIMLGVQNQTPDIDDKMYDYFFVAVIHKSGTARITRYLF